MCLVEVKPGPPKPQASCALPAAEGQEIFTKTPMVKKAREGVMEFLLINHPLDCPICDQGGECDLQDQAMGYGRDDSRYEENKRAVEEKAMGPLIKTVMTRCIQCTRCVRFITEVAGSPEIGLISPRRRRRNHDLSGRGGDVGAQRQRHRPVPGRRPDLQALRLRGAALGAEEDRERGRHGRPGLGHPRRRKRRAPSCRVLPRVNEDVNEEWITDKTRYAVDGLQRQRLDRPYVRVGGKLQPATWAQAFAAVAAKIKAAKPERVGVIAGDLQDAESLKATKDLFTALGVEEPATPARTVRPWAAVRAKAGCSTRPDRRHRERRRGAVRRRQPAPRGPGPERPLPQAVDRRQDPLRRDRSSRPT